MFQGDSEIGTLLKMFMILGTPENNGFPHWSDRFPKWSSRTARAKLITDLSPESGVAGLILECLKFEPNERVSAKNALNKEWFNRVRDSSESSGGSVVSRAGSPMPCGYF